MYQRILVGTDGSASATGADEGAVGVAGDTGASLTILTAARADRGDKIVAEAAARHAGSGVAIDTKVIESEPVAALINEAKAGGYDLLVTGNKGMTGLSRFFHLGSVPNTVPHHLPCHPPHVKPTVRFPP